MPFGGFASGIDIGVPHSLDVETHTLRKRGLIECDLFVRTGLNIPDCFLKHPVVTGAESRGEDLDIARALGTVRGCSGITDGRDSHAILESNHETRWRLGLLDWGVRTAGGKKC